MILPWRERRASPDGPSILTSLTERETTELRFLADCQTVVEVGSAYGYSAISMAPLAEHVWAIDPHQALMDSLGTMRANLAAYDVEGKVSVVLARSEHALAGLWAMGCRVGLAFIDGDHLSEQVATDVRLARRLLVPGGALACHDFGEDTCPGVRDALDKEFPAGPDRLVDTLAIYLEDPL